MKKILEIMFLFAASAFLLASCGSSSGGGSGGGGGGNTSESVYVGTQNPGDVWTWSFLGKGFNATNETSGYTYSGTHVNLPSGFKKLTVTASTDPAIKDSLPVYDYVLEIPDTALIVKTSGVEDDAIVGAALGACPSGDATYNWTTLVNNPIWNSVTDVATGISNTTVSGSTFDFFSTLSLINGTSAGTATEPGFVCVKGKLTTELSDTTIVATPSGVLIGDKGPGEGGFIGMQAPSVDVDLNDVVLAGRQYRGILIRDGAWADDPTREDTSPIWAEPDGLGGFEGGEFIDIDAGIMNTTEVATITFGVQTSPGIVNGTINDGMGDEDIVFMINKINGKYFVYGISIDTLSGDGNNFVVLEQ